MKAEGFIPQQVFKGAERGSFFLKTAKSHFHNRGKKALPGHKPMKDRLTLLMSGNASGDFKVKPLLIYHTDNPRMLKRNNVMKRQMPVMLRADAKAWVTRQFSASGCIKFCSNCEE